MTPQLWLVLAGLAFLLAGRGRRRNPSSSGMGWQYNGSRKWWEGSRGTGAFVVQKGRHDWYVARKPWYGDIQVVGTGHATRGAAMREAERLAGGRDNPYHTYPGPPPSHALFGRHVGKFWFGADPPEEVVERREARRHHKPAESLEAQHDRIREQIRAKKAQLDEHRDQVPNLRDFGLDKRDEFEAAVRAHNAEQKRLNDEYQELGAKRLAKWQEIQAARAKPAEAPKPAATISDRLAAAGFRHERTADTERTGRRAVVNARTGEVVGQFDSKEAADFLKRVEGEAPRRDQDLDTALNNADYQVIKANDARDEPLRGSDLLDARAAAQARVIRETSDASLTRERNELMKSMRFGAGDRLLRDINYELDRRKHEHVVAEVAAMTPGQRAAVEAPALARTRAKWATEAPEVLAAVERGEAAERKAAQRGHRLRVSVDDLDRGRLAKVPRSAIYAYEPSGARPNRVEAAERFARENNLPSDIHLKVDDDETRGQWRHSWGGTVNTAAAAPVEKHKETVDEWRARMEARRAAGEAAPAEPENRDRLPEGRWRVYYDSEAPGVRKHDVGTPPEHTNEDLRQGLDWAARSHWGAMRLELHGTEKGSAHHASESAEAQLAAFRKRVESMGYSIHDVHYGAGERTWRFRVEERPKATRERLTPVPPTRTAAAGDREREVELRRELSELETLAPRFSEGAISATQLNRMSKRQQAKRDRDMARRYAVEAELAELRKSPEQRAAEATRRDQEAAEKKRRDRLGQVESEIRFRESVHHRGIGATVERNREIYENLLAERAALRGEPPPRRYRVERQSYSRSPWRVLNEKGEQVWQSSSYAMRLPNGRYVDMPIGAPVAFDRKRDAQTWIEAQLGGEPASARQNPRQWRRFPRRLFRRVA